jgi:hypothetical protein
VIIQVAISTTVIEVGISVVINDSPHVAICHDLVGILDETDLSVAEGIGGIA